MRFAQRVLLVALLVSALGPINATANPILINGSLELGPSFSNQDIDIVSGSTAIIGWTVTGTSSAGAIDYLGPPWNVSDGIHAVDLDGRNSIAGGIEQSFTTIVGQTYSVSFDLSGNPAGGPLMKEVRVAAGEFTQDYQFDSTGQTITSPKISAFAGRRTT